MSEDVHARSAQLGQVGQALDERDVAVEEEVVVDQGFVPRHLQTRAVYAQELDALIDEPAQGLGAWVGGMAARGRAAVPVEVEKGDIVGLDTAGPTGSRLEIGLCDWL